MTMNAESLIEKTIAQYKEHLQTAQDAVITDLNRNATRSMVANASKCSEYNAVIYALECLLVNLNHTKVTYE
jgi:hypothetical protein